jgi:hypothetical protein
MKQIIRVEKLSTFGEIAASAEHTNRERLTKNADPKLTPKNVFVGARTSQEVVQAIKKRLENVQVNDDSVLCFEYLVTASPSFFESKRPKDIEEYWRKTDEWMEKRHGKENIVSNVLHVDETTLHKIYYVVPLIESEAKQVKRSVYASMAEFEAGLATLDKKGKPRKTILVNKPGELRLSAKTFTGGRYKMTGLQTDFYENVSKSCGLERGVQGSTAKHQDVKHFYAELEPKMKAANAVIDEAKQAEEALNSREAALVKRESLLKQAEAWIHSQKQIIADAFEHLPAAVQEKMHAIFKVKKAPETAKTINPHSSQETTLKTLKTSSVEASKPSRSRGPGY